MALPIVTGEYRLMEDPTLRFSPGGQAVCNMRLVADSKKKQGDDWVDDKVFFIKATAFGRLGENCAESLTKGTLVEVSGRIQTEQWEKDGEKKSAPAIIVDRIGPSLKWDTATVNKVERSGGGGQRQQSGGQSEPDPWATPDPPQVDEPPF